MKYPAKSRNRNQILATAVNTRSKQAKQYCFHHVVRLGCIRRKTTKLCTAHYKRSLCKTSVIVRKKCMGVQSPFREEIIGNTRTYHARVCWVACSGQLFIIRSQSCISRSYHIYADNLMIAYSILYFLLLGKSTTIVNPHTRL